MTEHQTVTSNTRKLQCGFYSAHFLSSNTLYVDPPTLIFTLLELT